MGTSSPGENNYSSKPKSNPAQFDDVQKIIHLADSTLNNSIRIFIDCPSCDMDYIRYEMPFLDYVREVREAQVYILVTNRKTASGGEEYTLFFSGQQEFSGIKDTLIFVKNPDDTKDITRGGLTSTMAMGMMRYVVKTSLKKKIEIKYLGEIQDDPKQLDDKWNFWVFEFQTQPDFSLEKWYREFEWDNSFTVNRITPEWKFENEFEHEYDREVYIKESENDETGVTTETRKEAVTKGWSYRNMTVKSLNDHWSAGIKAGSFSSSYKNLDLQIRLAPAIEYNIFPYYQSSQKQLRILYTLGFVHNNYSDTTVFYEVKESLFEQSLDIALQVQQKWGSTNVYLGASNYLHDFNKNRFELEGNLRIRIFKGLSFSVSGRAALIHNQIELAKGKRSDEDIYLKLRELETNYLYEAQVGLVYTFGSIYNNIVNPRFGK